MHSIPPLVTISSSNAGRTPWVCSWRSIRYSRRLGMPSQGAYWSATPALVAHELAPRSRRAARTGTWPGSGSRRPARARPRALPARIVVSSAAAWFCARRAKVTMPWHDTEMDGRDGLTRRDALGLLGGTVAGAWLLGRVELASGLGDGDYWAFADRCQRLLDDLWSPGLGHYQSGGRGETSMNANLLFTHASAALAGHQGAARQDERARAIALRLCQAPPWRPEGTGSAADRPPRSGPRLGLGRHDGLARAPARRDRRGGRPRPRADVAGARAARARRRVGGRRSRPPSTRCATSPFYAYPALRLNQINWPVEIFHWAALVTGDTRLLHHETRLQLGRFADAPDARGPAVPDPAAPARATGSTTCPGDRADARANLDSPEYATAVCGALQFYEPALRAGMDPLLPRQRAALLAWVERVLCGYFTHAGYLNWDTGASFRRWHQATKFGLAQGALLGIAVHAVAAAGARARPLGQVPVRPRARAVRPLVGRWRRAAAAGAVRRHPDAGRAERGAAGGRADPGQRRARGGARARRAAVRGRRRRCTPTTRTSAGSRSPRPPTARRSRWSTTSGCRTAAPSWRGCSTARCASPPGSAAARRPSFGVVARSQVGTGRRVASQRGRPRANLRAPAAAAARGAARRGARPEAYPRRPYAGPFRTLEAVAVTRDEALTITTRHRFRADHVETRWTIDPRRAARGRWSVDVLFPSTGAGASVDRRAGRRRPRAARRAPARRRALAPRGERGLRLRDRAARARRRAGCG